MDNKKPFLIRITDLVKKALGRGAEEGSRNENEDQSPFTSESQEMFPYEIPGFRLSHSYFNEKLAGSNYRLIKYKNLKIGSEIIFEKEPDNPFDSYAVRATCEGRMLGYVARRSDMYYRLNDFLDTEEAIVKGYLTGFNKKKQEIFIQTGIYLSFVSEKDKRRNAMNLKDSTMVYFTPKGKTFHVNNQCFSLSRSTNVQCSTLKEALENGRENRCDFCS